MKTPKNFDYDLWTTEDGKNMVRIKATGEVTEVSHEIMKLLRAEEKRYRREMEGVPINGCKTEKATLLSLDFISLDNNTEGCMGMEPWWLIDKKPNPEMVAMLNELRKEFIESLTPTQKEIFLKCLYGGLSLRKFAKENSLSFSSVHDSVEAIRNKCSKIFDNLK